MPKSPSNGNPLNRNLSPPPLPGSPSPGITAPRNLSDLGLGADFCPFYLLLCWQNPHLAHAKLRFCRLASGTEGETRSLRHQKSSGKAQTRQTPWQFFSENLKEIRISRSYYKTKPLY